jgi:hypothetical protein
MAGTVHLDSLTLPSNIYMFMHYMYIYAAYLDLALHTQLTLSLTRAVSVAVASASRCVRMTPSTMSVYLHTTPCSDTLLVHAVYQC